MLSGGLGVGGALLHLRRGGTTREAPAEEGTGRGGQAQRAEAGPREAGSHPEAVAAPERLDVCCFLVLPLLTPHVPGVCLFLFFFLVKPAGSTHTYTRMSTMSIFLNPRSTKIHPGKFAGIPPSHAVRGQVCGEWKRGKVQTSTRPGPFVTQAPRWAAARRGGGRTQSGWQARHQVGAGGWRPRAPPVAMGPGKGDPSERTGKSQPAAITRASERT